MRIPSCATYGMAALFLAGAALTPTVAPAQSSAAGMRDGKGPFSASINASLTTGAVNGQWRHMGYHMMSGQPLQGLDLNRPQTGATFHWQAPPCPVAGPMNPVMACAVAAHGQAPGWRPVS